jgi:Ca-activated chloride channel family protein
MGAIEAMAEMRTKAAWRTLLFLAAVSPAALAQNQFSVDVNSAQTPFKVNVQLVSVAFTAQDSRGALVGNLSKDDLELLEDGVPQKIEFFARSTDLPLTLALIVDASGSQDHFGSQHKKALEVFLKQILRPQDRVFLLAFGNHLRLVSDYSNSPEQILESYQRWQKSSKGFPELGPHEDRDLGTAFYDSIFYSVTEKLAPAEGRKAILMFSDGEDNSSSHNMMTTIETAQAANVPIYAIRYTETHHGKLNARNKYGISVMDRMAKETGGLHINAERTEPDVYFQQIAEELRSSYDVGYYSTNKVKDDTFRKIAIRTQVPGVTIRSKTGYFASTAATTEQNDSRK